MPTVTRVSHVWFGRLLYNVIPPRSAAVCICNHDALAGLSIMKLGLVLRKDNGDYLGELNAYHDGNEFIENNKVLIYFSQYWQSLR